jgi:vanillate O-demethylase monooxygenase subunit
MGEPLLYWRQTKWPEAASRARIVMRTDVQLPETPTVDRPKARELADYATPFIFNCWYIAALGEQIDRSLTGRMILGRSILLYRREDGTAVALRNRCPHRSFPLSHGRLVGDDVECGYHGMTYAPDGRCVLIPSQETIPATFRVRSYPLVERGPFLWIWMGDADAADPSEIPAFPVMSDAGSLHVEGYFYVKGNYVGLHENVLDLTHAPYLHGVDAATMKFAAIPAHVEVDGYVVKVSRVEPDSELPPHRAAVLGRNPRVDRKAESFFLTPGVHLSYSYYYEANAPAGAEPLSRFEIVHAFTPETHTSTHYFWANATHEIAADREEMARVMRARSTKVYSQDVDAAQWVEDLRESEADEEFREVSVASDRAGIAMRRILVELAMKEKGEG